MNKKGEEENSSMLGTLIAVLLALIVIIVILYFLLNNGSWNFFKNLPGNKYDKNDKEIVLPPDQNIITNYFQVAKILDGKYIRFCTNGDCNKLRNSNLYWYGDERNAGIYVDQSWAIDKKIGDVSSGKIKIDEEVLNGGNLYTKVQSLLPDYSDLVNLDNSIYISGTIYRDKPIVVNSGDKVFGKISAEVSFDPAKSGTSDNLKDIKAVDNANIININGNFYFDKEGGLFSSSTTISSNRASYNRENSKIRF